MRTLLRRLPLVWVLTVAFLPAFGQITITASDVTAQFAVGNTLSYHFDLLTTQVNVGAPGASSWDFSALRNDSTQTLTSVALSTVPSAIRNEFPNATYAMRTSLVFQGIPGTAYQFFRLDTDLLNPGFGARDATGLLILTSKNVPTELFYRLPSTLGTSWSTAFTTTVALNGQTLSTTTHDARYVVDAYGPMAIRGGGVVQALRIRKTDIINGNPVRSFIFLAQNGASVIITACDTSVISGTIQHCGSTIQWSSPVNTDVRTLEETPSHFTLEQNYPNPFNPSTTIRFGLPHESFVTLKVYNSLGQEVAELFSGSRPAGQYSVEWNAEGLASGIYYYRLVAGQFSATRKMMFLR